MIRAATAECDTIDLSIVVINWNGGSHLRNCLESIRRAPPAVSFNVIVVDNASTDGSLEWLLSDATVMFGRTLQVIRNKENVGFSIANNQAALLSRAPLLLLLNSDTEVRPGSIDRLIATLRADDRIAACGPRLINPDGSLQANVWPNPPTPGEILVSGLRLYLLLPKRLRGSLLLGFHWDHDEPRDVRMLMGSAVLIRRAALEDVGGFDERFPMYASDCEWCLRTVRAGWKLFFEPAAVVMHHGSLSALARWGKLERERQSCAAAIEFQRISLSPAHAAANSAAACVVYTAEWLWRWMRGRARGDVLLKLVEYSRDLRRKSSIGNAGERTSRQASGTRIIERADSFTVPVDPAGKLPVFIPSRDMDTQGMKPRQAEFSSMPESPPATTGRGRAAGNGDIVTTVVIPTYNRGERLGLTLDHLLASDVAGFAEVEIVVVDDGSPTPAAPIVDSRLAVHPFSIRCIRQSNAGPAAARNRGFQVARGDIVLFMDDDILCRPDLLRRHVEMHAEFPGTVIFGRSVLVEPARKTPLFRYLVARDRDLCGGETRPHEKVAIVASGHLSVERRMFHPQDGVYRSDLSTPAAEEFELSARLAERRIPILMVPGIVGLHHQPIDVETLCRQAYKYGTGVSEAAVKCSSARQLPVVQQILAANAPRVSRRSLPERAKVLLKRSLSGRAVRSGFLACIRLLEAVLPNSISLSRLYHTVLGLYYFAGIRDGVERFGGRGAAERSFHSNTHNPASRAPVTNSIAG